MATNPLSRDSLLRLAFLSLPKASQRLNHRNDVAALFTNACMLAVGFKLVGFDGNRFENPSTADKPVALPSTWNTAADFTFQYTHPQSSMNYIMKLLALGDKSMVVATSLEDDQTVTLDLALKDIVPSNSYPVSLPSLNDDKQLGDFLNQKNLISSSSIIDLGDKLKVGIIQKLMPGLHKAGYQESSPRGSEAPQREEDPSYDPLREARPPIPASRIPPLGRWDIEPPRTNPPTADFPPPGFEDEHQVFRPAGHRPYPTLPLAIGHDDLYPPGLGPYDPFIGGPRHSGGGMHPTFPGPNLEPPGARNGGGLPLGARWDPVFTPGRPGNLNMFPGGRGGSGDDDDLGRFRHYEQGDFI
ncbi:MAG: hypothetical protein M1829_001302 [Trizodia sp. TS-e1964]|nr:MAG: hypothetical protein M1829_001302 [Trizodia sp. TS-e1964]